MLLGYNGLLLGVGQRPLLELVEVGYLSLGVFQSVPGSLENLLAGIGASFVRQTGRDLGEIFDLQKRDSPKFKDILPKSHVNGKKTHLI